MTRQETDRGDASPETVDLTASTRDRFLHAWQSGLAPSIEEFVPVDCVDNKELPSWRAVLLELIPIDLDYRWQMTTNSGATADQPVDANDATLCGIPDQPCLDDYLAAFPWLRPAGELPIETICAEYRARMRYGDRPPQQLYAEAYSSHGNQLMERLADIDRELAMDDTLAEVVGDTTSSDAPDDIGEAALLATLTFNTTAADRKPGPQSYSSSDFGEYEILEEVARGGMGVVYKARQKKANRIVALKMMLSGQLAEAEDVKRFHVEAEAAAGLDHPNIVPVYDVGEAEGRHYFSMAYVEGQSLSEVVREQPLEPRRAAELIAQVAEAVEYAHQKQIIHRDLKPANILLDLDGTPRVTDFGLAKLVKADSQLTATGQVMGTPSYMSPEQAMGASETVGPISDVYSLGAVLYHLVTGRAPFRAATLMGTLEQVIKQDPVPVSRLISTVDRDLDTIILKSLQKEKSNRYASAHDFADDLRRFLEHRPIQARRTSAAERVWRWAKRNRLAAGLLGTVITTVLATLVFTSYASIVYREMADEESRLRNRMAESLYLAEMSSADDVLDKSQLQQTTTNKLMHWYPGNPNYANYVADTTRDLRGWEWYFLFAASQRTKIAVPGRMLAVDVSRDSLLGFGFDNNFSVIRFEQQSGGVTWNAHTKATVAVKFSPDGQSIATAGLDGGVGVWNVQTREKLASLIHATTVRSLSFNDTGRLLVTHAEDAKVRVWDLETKTIAVAIDAGVSATPACAVSPNGRLIAAGAHVGDTYPVRVWDLATGDKTTTFLEEAHTRPILSIAWSPNSQRIVSGGEEGTVRVWDRSQNKLSFSFTRHDQPVHAVAWSPDGKTIASAGVDMEVRHFDATNGEQTGAYGHEGGELAKVRSLAWGPHSQKLVAAIELGVLDIIDLGRRRHRQSFSLETTDPQSAIASLHWRPQQTELSATIGNRARTWTTKSGVSGPQAERLACWSDNNSYRAAIHGSDLVVQKGDTIVLKTPLAHAALRLQWNPRHDILAVQSQQAIHVWRQTTTGEVTEFVTIDHQKMGEIDSLGWSSDGSKLVVGTSQGHIQIYHQESGKRDLRLQAGRKGHQQNRVRAIAWKPNSTLFAVGMSNNYIYLYDYATLPRRKGEKIDDRGIPAHDAHLRGLAWSPDGSRLASASADRTVRLWNLDVNRLEDVAIKRVLTIPHASEVRDVVWSTNGRQLATLTNRGVVTLFDATWGYDRLQVLDANPDAIGWDD